MKIKAIDGCTLNINGTAYPIPKGTEMNIAKSNASGLAITATELNGDGTSTPRYSRIRGHLSGVQVRLSDDALEDSFNDSFGEEDNIINLNNGDTTYSIESGMLVSPQEDSTPEINHVTRISEAFTCVSANGQVIARSFT